MKTNFFQIIAHLKSLGSWTIHIAPVGADGNMIVSVLLSDPVSEKLGIALSPMIFNENPKSIDESLFIKLTEPVKEINELFVNSVQVNQTIENAKKILAEKAKGSKSTTPVKVDDGAEKKQKYEDVIKKVGELNALCKYAEALELLPLATDYPEKQGDLDKLRKELETKNKQLSFL